MHGSTRVFSCIPLLPLLRAEAEGEIARCKRQRVRMKSRESHCDSEKKKAACARCVCWSGQSSVLTLPLFLAPLLPPSLTPSLPPGVAALAACHAGLLTQDICCAGRLGIERVRDESAARGRQSEPTGPGWLDAIALCGRSCCRMCRDEETQYQRLDATRRD